MKRGCLIALMTWAACAGVYWYLVHARFQPPLDWIVPVAAGFIMAMVIGNLQTAFASARAAAQVAQQLGERPKDGEVVTVPGHIRASGAPLHAPISGRAAVLYSYEISHDARTSDSNASVKDYSGFAMTPAVIDSPYGPIRLLGFPMLDSLEKERLDTAMARQNATSYVATAQFLDMSGFHPATLYREMKDLLTDDDGQLRKDWRMTTAPLLTDDNDMFEQIVAPGEQVCAIGRYSADKGGLIPDLGRGNPLQLLRGDAQATSGRLWRKTAGTVIGVLIFAVAVNGVLFGLLKLREGQPPFGIPKSRSQLRDNIQTLHDASRNGDVPTMERVVVREGTPVDGRDAEESTPLTYAADGKTAAWLIAHGADVNAANEKGETVLMEHAHSGHADVVKVLIKAGANLDVFSTKWKSTALQQALDAERLDVVQILRDAGAHDVTVTGKNGRAIGKSSPQAKLCFDYLDAIQDEDRETVNSLRAREPLAQIDFKTWKESRPVKPRLVSGFANDDAATLALRGARTDGVHETWTFQLVRREGRWKVSDERWETRLDGKEP